MRSRIPEVLIGGLFLLVAAFLVGGRYQSHVVGGGGGIATVDRLMGEIRFCEGNTCKTWE